jgi:membrane associated rhomboid family serine protease
MYLTLFIILITSVVSVLAFNNINLLNKLKFNAYMVWHKKQFERLFTHALVHSGWLHLLINMYVLWIFGQFVEDAFIKLFSAGKFLYVLMYVLAVPFSTIPALLRNKNNHYYNSVGASGAVSAVVFTTILLAPKTSLFLMFIPIPIPAYIFGLLYLIYSYFMSKRSRDNIAHDAHFAGSVFGFTFPIIIQPHLFLNFISLIF